MSNKFDLVDFGEDKAKKVAEVMNNKTCKKIIDSLKNKRASASAISQELGLPLSTIQYNIQKLIDAEMVKIKDFYWSSKGNKVYIYELTNKVMVFSHNKTKKLENSLRLILPVLVLASLVLIIGIIYFNQNEDVVQGKFSRFESGDDLLNALKDSQNNQRNNGGILKGEIFAMDAAGMAESTTTQSSSDDYSQTNIQVQGVDEADIVKTDGKYIYALANSKLNIVSANSDSEILSQIKFDENFYANEIFIDENRVLVFGSSYDNIIYEEDFSLASSTMPSRSYGNFLKVILYDTTEKESPVLIRELSFEGSYLSSRKIGDYAYFVFNSYPSYYDEPLICDDVLPVYKENEEEFKQFVSCTDVGYIYPYPANNFITLASISLKDESEEIGKEVVLGNGNNVYVSENNFYIVQSLWGYEEEKTNILKYKLDQGKIEFIFEGEVKGNILNQFSMDEFENNFRIATTISGYENNKDTSYNNLYVLDEALNLIGSVENIAPGESIYSVRFMGERAYMVTFRHIDPLFVIDLSNPENPEILGQLKIPGYSDYLHPFDETHLIGIGKEVDASIDADKIHTEGAIYYTAIQGVKLAIFDVSDVENPIEMHKEVIGDRGSESLATSEHKAFLFDKEKGLLILPMIVAQLKQGQDKSEQGDYVFDGAYVYDISLENGFDLRGKVTQYDDDSVFKKSGYYFQGDSSIYRSLYVGDILYTLSSSKLQLNDLETLEKIKRLEF